MKPYVKLLELFQMIIKYLKNQLKIIYLVLRKIIDLPACQKYHYLCMAREMEI